jgi:hypothetical protein
MLIIILPALAILAVVAVRRLTAGGRARAEIRKQDAVRAQQARRGTLPRTTTEDPRFSGTDHERAVRAGEALMRKLGEGTK